MAITLDGTNGITTPDVDTDDLSIDLGSMDIVASLGGSFPMWTYRNGSGSWFHAGKHPTDDAFVITTGATPTTTEHLRVDPSGNLLVGKTSSTQYESGCIFKSDLAESAVISADNNTVIIWADNVTANTGGAKGHILFKRGTNGVLVGSITSTTTTTYYNTSSDYRLKEDVQPMTGASQRVLALNPVNFAWKADGTRVDGFLAHEAQAVVPEAVTGAKDAVDAEGDPEYQGIDQSKLVPLLTAALQEALGEIESLKARIEVLEAKP